MRFLDNLRTAYQLASRVEEVEKRVENLEFEWGEVQEKLLTREERLRKRLSRELKANLDEAPWGKEPGPAIVPPEGKGAAKQAIAARFNAQRLKKEG